MAKTPKTFRCSFAFLIVCAQVAFLLMINQWNRSWCALQSGALTPLPTALATTPYLEEHKTENDATNQCNLCKEDWLFVFSARGRTGSTTLMKMVNSIPGVELNGENQGVLSSLRAISKNLMYTKSIPFYSWHHPGALNRREMLCQMQAFVKTILGIRGSKRLKGIIGFKEIRHGNADDIAFFKDLFPCARYIVNVRGDPSKQCDSRKRAGFHGDCPMDELEANAKVLLDFAKQMGQRAFVLELEKFSVESFNTMLAWLGVKGCKYTALHHSNIGKDYDRSQPKKGDKKVLEGNCSVVPFIRQKRDLNE